MPPVLDTNVILRHLLQDDSRSSARATRVMTRIAEGELNVAIADTTIFELAFILERRQGWSRGDIASTLLVLVELAKVDFPERLRQTLDLFARFKFSFADAYQAAVAMESEPPEIISFDHDFDRIPGLRRVEPGAAA